MTLKLTFTALLAALLLAGCASSGLGSRDYQRSEARRIQEVRMGVVESVRAVNLEGTKSGVGAIAGAALGGVAGSAFGSGTGRTLATVAGAVAGGMAGSAVEENTTKQPGLEITVRTDNGQTFAVTQADDGERFNIGDRVRILESGGQARVTH